MSYTVSTLNWNHNTQFASMVEAVKCLLARRSNQPTETAVLFDADGFIVPASEIEKFIPTIQAQAESTLKAVASYVPSTPLITVDEMLNFWAERETYVLSTREMEEARAWLSDCVWPDVDSDEIEEMPDATIIRAVKRHYEGGIAAFILASS